MKSLLGLVFATGVVLAFAVAWWLGERDAGSLLDRAVNQQWLFLVALPYNLSSVWLLGESNFSPDAAGQVAAAATSEATLAYLTGAALETVTRRIWRAMRRITTPA